MSYVYNTIDLDAVPDWRPNYAYGLGELYKNLGTIYEIKEAHISTSSPASTLSRSTAVVPRLMEVAYSTNEGWGADERLYVYSVPRKFTFPATLDGSVFSVLGGSISAGIELYKNGSKIGEINWNGNTTPTITFSTETQFIAGDTFMLIGKDDENFDSFSMTLVGQRPLTSAE